MSWRAGLARADLTVYEQDGVMWGWAQEENRARVVHTALTVRALVLEHGGERLAVVTAELAMISTALRESVLAKLAGTGLDTHRLLLTATHTHSGPGGFSRYLAYAAPTLGYSESICDALAQRIAGAIQSALERCAPATLRVGQATIPHHEPVAFQRSCEAYNRNHDVIPVDPRRPELATHREMVTLRVDADGGRPLGAVSWFGVHGTSVHADQTSVHPDNKGLAAARVERAMGGDFVAIFQQEAAGDVTPNHVYDRRRARLVGEQSDDFASAADNARIQARHAMRAWEHAAGRAPLQGPLRSALRHVDLAAYRGPGRIETRRARFALGMAAGTAEGPGPMWALRRAIRAASSGLVALGAWDAAIPWIAVADGARGKFVGLLPTSVGRELCAPHIPMIDFLDAALEATDDDDAPWVPQVLPIQLVRIGSLAIGALPCEPTTVVGRRLRRSLVELLGRDGVTRAVVAGYANDYAGYLTTPEEYAAQCYEGAATYFGPASFDAYRSALVALTGDLPSPTTPPPGPSLRSFEPQIVRRQTVAGRARVEARRRRVAGL